MESSGKGDELCILLWWLLLDLIHHPVDCFLSGFMLAFKAKYQVPR